MAGLTIKLFLVEGTPTGTLTAEIGNWTGKVIVAAKRMGVDVAKSNHAPMKVAATCVVGVLMVVGCHRANDELGADHESLGRDRGSLNIRLVVHGDEVPVLELDRTAVVSVATATADSGGSCALIQLVPSASEQMHRFTSTRSDLFVEFRWQNRLVARPRVFGALSDRLLLCPVVEDAGRVVVEVQEAFDG